jgi:toxin ParE1/3/4
MARYRLTNAAQADMIAILSWSQEQFGEQARQRYEALIVAAIRDAASRTDDVGHTPRPELGADQRTVARVRRRKVYRTVTAPRNGHRSTFSPTVRMDVKARWPLPR